FWQYQHLHDYLRGIYTPSFGNQNIVEFLFIKRADGNISHAGDVAFPGGKCDENETDYEACVREVEEELSIKVGSNDQFSYMGKLPLNIFAYHKKGKKTFMSVQLFFMHH